MSTHDREKERDALAEYAASGSEDAFRRVVEAWLPLVMGTALRRLGGQRAMAEDVTQLVFIDLARQAGSVRGATLSGWLFKHTCFTVSKVMRGERRRAHRERMAAEHAPQAGAATTGDLDELLLDLGENDRATLLLRYVEGRSHDEVAQVLGISRSAAQKRSERALERLRQSYQSDLTGAGLAMALAPPLTGMEGLAHSISGAAVSGAGSASTVSILANPLAGALWGAAAAIALAAVPLATMWRDVKEAKSAAPVVVPSGGGSNAGKVPRGNATAAPRADAIQSPEEAVEALLAVADRYGVGPGSARRASAIVESLPPEWIHEVLLGLGRRTPVNVRGTYWFPAVSKSLAKHWRPRRVPDDLIVAWPQVPMNVREKLFGGCAAVDLPATLELLEGFETEHRLADLGIHRMKYRKGLREAIMVHLLQESPREAVAFYSAAPGNTWSDLMSRGVFSKARRDPVIRREIWDALPSDDGANRHQMGMLMIYVLGQEEKRALVEEIDDSRLRALLATAVADMNNDEEWWQQQVPESMRLEMAARLGGGSASSQSRAVQVMIEMEGPDGGPEYDSLRWKAVQLGQYRREVDHAAVVSMADRITNPAMRMVALSKILPQYEGSQAWMREHLGAAEREVLKAVWIPGNFY